MGVWIRFYLKIIGIILLEVCFIDGMHVYIASKSRVWQNQQGIKQKYLENIAEEMKCFPIPIAYRDEISYADTYGAARESGGHEGCDIMDNENMSGRIPVVSVADGVITNLGWLYLGGYRIGITSENGIYYYYAHLDSYASGLFPGKEIKAGELLGFMGSTGEGEEGTEGKFPVHLHFGIYLYIQEGNEETVNSYPFLREIDGG